MLKGLSLVALLAGCAGMPPQSATGLSENIDEPASADDQSWLQPLNELTALAQDSWPVFNASREGPGRPIMISVESAEDERTLKSLLSGFLLRHPDTVFQIVEDASGYYLR